MKYAVILNDGRFELRQDNNDIHSDVMLLSDDNYTAIAKAEKTIQNGEIIINDGEIS
jgi:hypothetical protein